MSISAAINLTTLRTLAFVLISVLMMTSCQKEELIELETTERKEQVTVTDDDFEILAGDNSFAKKLIDNITVSELKNNAFSNNNFDLVGVHDNQLAIGNSETGLQHYLISINGNYSINNASWSLNRDKIAFTASKYGENHLLVINADGSDFRVVTSVILTGSRLPSIASINWANNDELLLSRLAVVDYTTGFGSNFIIHTTVATGDYEFTTTGIEKMDFSPNGSLAYNFELNPFTTQPVSIKVQNIQTGNTETWVNIPDPLGTAIIIETIDFVDENNIYIIVKELASGSSSSSSGKQTLMKLTKKADGSISVFNIFSLNAVLGVTSNGNPNEVLFEVNKEFYHLNIDDNGQVLSEKFVGSGRSLDWKNTNSNSES